MFSFPYEQVLLCSVFPTNKKHFQNSLFSITSSTFCILLMMNNFWICSGFPIPNDPIYNSPAWGPNRGKGGDFGKSEEQVIMSFVKACSGL